MLRQRSKRFHTKSFTGCQTCKKRKIKCDEERPTCRRCRASGWQCEGYDMIRVVQVADVNEEPPTSASISRQLSPTPLCLRGAASQDVAFFDYFRLHILPDISGPFHSVPWYTGVSSVFFESPAVYHASVALGALACADQEPQVSSPPREDIAMRHYNTAIKSLSGSLAAPETITSNVLALTAILFVALELHQSQYEQAKVHLLAVLQFVSDINQSPSRFSAVSKREINIDPSILRLLERLDLQFSAFTSARIYLNQREETTNLQDLLGPEPFRSVEDASYSLTRHRAAMRELLHRVQRLEDGLDTVASDNSETLMREVARQLLVLSEWERATIPLTSGCLKMPEERVLTTLQVQHMTCKLQVANSLNHGREMLWDRFSQDFEYLLDLLDRLLQAQVPSLQRACTHELPMPSLQPTKEGIYLELGIIPAAYLTALKCRDSTLRHRALKILRDSNLREGVWDSASAAVQAKSVVDLEEKSVAPGAIIPENCRLNRAWYDLSATGIHTLYCRRRLFETTGKWIDYVIDLH